jgi:Na+/H+-dicarboxylate symporter
MFVTAACVSPLFIVLGPGLSGDNQSGGGIGSLLNLILGIIPPNIVQPFIDGNTLQIIFLAVIVAFGLFYLGNQTVYLAETIGQINVLVNYHMGLVSTIVPYVIFLVVVNMIYSNTLATALGMWKFLLVLMVAILVTAAFSCSTPLSPARWTRAHSPANAPLPS